MVQITSLFFVTLAVGFASAIPLVPRIAAGTQFITGACTADADCASGCCAAGKGLCAARLVALEGAGCGFTSSAAVAPAAAAAATPPPAIAATATAAAAASTGTQFITGACSADADCASGCCAAGKNLCAARLVALEGAGCGGGSSAAAAAPAAAAPPPAVAASATAAAAAATGTQFITGACAADADCASGCCAAGKNTCAARLVALEGAGCGGGSSAAAAAPAAASAPAAVAATASAGSGKAPGTQFITGACASDADCASACCAFTKGTCAAPLVAQESEGGCGFGDASPNNNALAASKGKRDLAWRRKL